MVSTNKTSVPASDLAGLLGEYSTLQEGAGLLSFDADGITSVQGQDRVEWLHNLVTVNIKALKQGSGAYGLLLNGSAHVLADFVVLAQPESLLLYTSSRAKEKLYAGLRRSVFREHVKIEQLESFRLLSVQGPRSRQVLDAALGPLPDLEPFQFNHKGELLIVRNARAGGEGYDLIAPPAQLAATRDALVQQGARDISQDALNVARIESGIAWYGEDFDETMLAPEARLDPFLAENKGCYPGQEVIARIHNRGHVNRLLVQLLFEGQTVPRRGDLVFSGDRDVGWITSPTWSFARNAPFALGYVRREQAETGTGIQVAHDGDRLQARIVRH
jgi:folate-binding protein YgfZ